MAMEVTKVPPGERAPNDVDCIRIEAAPGGKYLLAASALQTCGDGEQSEAIISSDPYDSYEEAEAAGIAWAADHCVEKLYVECQPG